MSVSCRRWPEVRGLLAIRRVVVVSASVVAAAAFSACLLVDGLGGSGSSDGAVDAHDTGAAVLDARPIVSADAEPSIDDSGPMVSAMDAGVLTGDATRGAAVFAANCAACHGVDGKGTVAVPGAKSFASADVQSKTDTALGDVIENGQGGGTMPAFGTLLSAQQIVDLVAFIRTVR